VLASGGAGLLDLDAVAPVRGDPMLEGMRREHANAFRGLVTYTTRHP
jgi:hypothetical protein